MYVLQIWGKLMLQVGVFFIIKNWGNCCYKLGQLLQIRAIVITKYSSYYKLGQNILQIGTEYSN